MFDLSEEQITAFSLYSAVNESILPLPGTMKFLDTFCKHSASRERQGRKELVELATPHPISLYSGLGEMKFKTPEPPEACSQK
ncbi:hypothetical protein [Methanosarcina horonobensis]|uniref:hypothetical protein n=1 Tax=Methanosarcina horonobensis TaxID=418008 RepID=UPI000A4626EE|nr:hypothetical protein [Methanosarcina horonobensis]